MTYDHYIYIISFLPSGSRNSVYALWSLSLVSHSQWFDWLCRNKPTLMHRFCLLTITKQFTKKPTCSQSSRGLVNLWT